MKKKIIITLSIILVILVIGIIIYLYKYKGPTRDIILTESNTSNSTTPYIPNNVNDSNIIQIDTSLKPQNQPQTYNRSPENVKIEVIPSTITRDSAQILITDTNENPYSWGQDYKLQKKENGKWKNVKCTNKNLVFNSLAYILDDDNQIKFKVNYKEYCGSLKNGTYRIVKTVYDNGYIDLYSNEFEIK